MASKEDKFYVCAHTGCFFQTGKRKAIYTHLLRTHAERKEDFECEYCSAEFQDEVSMESHLQQLHPGQPVTYTCVSRIENVINRCAKLGQERRRMEANGQINNDSVGKSGNVVLKSERRISDTTVKVKSELGGLDGPAEYSKHTSPKARTKASVNASLNHIARHVENNGYISPEIDQFDDAYDNDESEFSTETAQPSGLKIKLNLKKISKSSSNKPPERSPTCTPPLEAEGITGISDDTRMTPQTAPRANTGSSSVEIREPATKYFDKLEVYHTTDALGHRCCPFCPYKTTKNTIRVHLSGIHKIYFVKCSLCDYKAAFPHQITQHGLKFHKTSKLNVIQLSKESREKVISQLPKSAEFERQLLENQQNADASSSEPIIEQDNTNCSFIDDVISSDSSSASEEEDNVDGPAAGVTLVVEERSFKPPKCQTSKTDYYNIQVENGVYLYCCNLCDFQTPVRATIYTHKYRHEQKSYRCGYCDYVSFPRSNVVHHMRYKHKDLPILVVDAGEAAVDENKAANKEETRQASERSSPVGVKKEPADDVSTACNITSPSESDNTSHTSGTNHSPALLSTSTEKPKPKPKSSPTIIKVPEYKRSLTPVAFNQINEKSQSPASKKGKANGLMDAGYKLSLNKLYRINPLGSPKFVCVRCPYACDTHPKMKHHLYRHRPQQYKCPYCEHRKYPRSYVVRHVRDTHRGKPLRVIDLSKGTTPIDITDTLDDITDDVDTLDNTAETGDAVEGEAGMEETYRLMNMYLQQGLTDQANDLSNNNTGDISAQDTNSLETIVKSEPDDQREYSRSSTAAGHATGVSDDATTPSSYKTLADKLQLNLSNDVTSDRMFAEESPDVAPNFSETVYTSTPLIESIINNGQFPAESPSSGSVAGSAASVKPLPGQTKNPEKKKSTKDYRIKVAGEAGPRYVCNKCGYGTENYKTIHNHMYRHESQRYQCPYCGYRRSPRSFVETHIREVHKGNPVLVTELTEDMDIETPIGSPRQCITGKRRPPFSSKLSPIGNKRFRVDNACSKLPKLPTKWPAPKPASKVLAVPKVNANSPAQTINPSVKQNLSPSGVSAHNATNVTSSTSGKSPSEEFSSEESSVISNESRRSPGLGENSASTTNTVCTQQFTYKEGSRTTFKTMYKCVFDPETCNHISKDKSKMKQHLFMHVEYKPWTCDRCDMTASQSSHIKSHVRAEHTGVSEMSFSYKKHNYLEKHIDGFLNKGLFTVPVSEYRRIMDMKGNTKSAQKSTFARDREGHLLCPYCDYRTKSGGMTDHVKMKHMQPRFKCHWCDFSAFYRSEVRKHHRKEKSHSGCEFKTQELDLSQVTNVQVPISVGSGGVYLNSDTSIIADDDSFIEENSDDADEDEREEDEREEDEGDEVRGDMDIEQNCDALAKLMSENPGGFSDISLANAPGFLETFNRAANEVLTACSDELGDTEQLAVKVKQEHVEQEDPVVDAPQVQDTLNGENTSIDRNKIKKESIAISEKSPNKGNKFKCGYCSFSATLRVKVKMHCSKKHPNKVLNVVEPMAAKTSGNSGEKRNNITRVDANDWKGTKFEQDLRRAGVSTLNLTSLFPRSKKCKVENETDESDMDTDSGILVDGEAVGDSHYKQSIPFDKDPVSYKPDNPSAKMTLVEKEKDPEFKVPRSPSTMQKGEKNASTKRSVSKADKLKHDRHLSNQKIVPKADAKFKQESDNMTDHCDNTNANINDNTPTLNSYLNTDAETVDDDMDIVVEPLDSEQSAETIEDKVREETKAKDINHDSDDNSKTEDSVTGGAKTAVGTTAVFAPLDTEYPSTKTHISDETCNDADSESGEVSGISGDTRNDADCESGEVNGVSDDTSNDMACESGDVGEQVTSPDVVVHKMVPSCAPVVLESGIHDDEEGSTLQGQDMHHSGNFKDTDHFNVQTSTDCDGMDNTTEDSNDLNLQSQQATECTNSTSEYRQQNVTTHQETNKIDETDAQHSSVLKTEITDNNKQETDKMDFVNISPQPNIQNTHEENCVDDPNDTYHTNLETTSMCITGDAQSLYVSNKQENDTMDCSDDFHQSNLIKKQHADGLDDFNGNDVQHLNLPGNCEHARSLYDEL